MANSWRVVKDSSSTKADDLDGTSPVALVPRQAPSDSLQDGQRQWFQSDPLPGRGGLALKCVGCDHKVNSII